MAAHQRLIDAWRLLRDIEDDFRLYSDRELWSIKNSAEVFVGAVRREQSARDARMVDEACALRTGDAA